MIHALFVWSVAFFMFGAAVSGRPLILAEKVAIGLGVSGCFLAMSESLRVLT